MVQAIAGDVGENTIHYLESIDHYRDDPAYGYLYHHWIASCQLVGPVDPEKFEAAVHDAAKASPVLRSHFGKKNGTWQHIIQPQLEKPFFTYQKHDPKTDWRDVIGKMTVDLNYQILPVWEAPLFKIWLQEFDDVAVVTFHIHHLVLDGWGLIVFFQQLIIAYEARLSGQPSPLTPLDENAFLSIAKQDENQWTDASDRQKKLDWWRDTIGTHSYVSDPLPEPVGYLEGCYGHIDPKASKASKALVDYCEKANLHYSYVIRAAYIKALQDWTNSEDVLLTSVKANRSSESGEVIANLAHWLINRHNAPRNTPLRELAQTVLAETETAKKHYLPYWDIVEHVCPRQYFCNFGITPFSFNYLSPIAMETSSGGSASLKSLFEFFDFSRRAIITEFFPRCLDSIDPETHEPTIAFDLGFNREFVDGDKAVEFMNRVMTEVTEAFC